MSYQPLQKKTKTKKAILGEALNAAQEQAKTELAAQTADGSGELTQSDIQATVEKH